MPFALAKPVIVARFSGAHGVRGQVRLRSFTADPTAVFGYGDLAAADGRSFRLATLHGESRGALIVTVAGIGDRDAAERLNGLDLAVDRSVLPPVDDEDEVYHADLIGLPAVTKDGAPFGIVAAVQDFGAGPMLELTDGRFLPFSRAVVPEIDLAAGRIIVDPPELVDPKADVEGSAA
jgi:16S rRNA processing protein RimM